MSENPKTIHHPLPAQPPPHPQQQQRKAGAQAVRETKRSWIGTSRSMLRRVSAAASIFLHATRQIMDRWARESRRGIVYSPHKTFVAVRMGIMISN